MCIEYGMIHKAYLKVTRRVATEESRSRRAMQSEQNVRHSLVERTTVMSIAQATTAFYQGALQEALLLHFAQQQPPALALND